MILIIKSKYCRILFFSILFFKNLLTNRCYLFTVIMSIYNTGRYIDESINSLLNQTIGFKNIQLILVNDGSVDDSEEKCFNYLNKYPNNIIYVKIEHSGLSKARNVGIKYAKGKYINYLDPDDKWDYRAFKYVLLFFRFNRDIDIIGARMKFFEAAENYHTLDYKFYKTRIVNLTIEYSCIHLSVASSFFRKSFMKDKLFEEGLLTGEDVRFINKYLLIKPFYGAIKEAVYYYRKRADSSSIVQNQFQNIKYYFDTINEVQNFLIKFSKSLYNKIIPFLQFVIGYLLVARIKSYSTFQFLDKYNLIKYCNSIESILKQIEDKYILEQKFISNYKLLALSKKYQRDLRYDIKLENDLFLYSGYIMINLNTKKNVIIWRILDIHENILHLEGIDNFWLPKENYFYYCKINNRIVFPKNYYYLSNYDFVSMYGIIEKGRIIVFDIPFEIINTTINFEFYISYMNNDIEIFPAFGAFTHIPTINNGYYIAGNYIMKSINKRLTIFRYDKKLEIMFEKLYCSELKKYNKNYIVNIRKKHRKYKKKLKKKKNYQIWLINDRRDRAGDNGEYFFRYLKTQKLVGIKVYFVIEKNNSDYKRLKKFGNIIDIDSEKYINKFLICDKIITSMTNSWVTNPFNNDLVFIRDLLHFDIIFLQHGITKDDISFILNRFIRNYSIFITSSKKEYKSILDPKYGYNTNNIKLTGFARFDNLENMKNTKSVEKKIIIIPTWRKNIRGTRDSLTYKSIHSDMFIYSNYFKFYNNLINDNNLLLMLNKTNYTGIFCLHPSLSSQYIDFDKNKYFTIIEKCNYQKLLLESSLLITDYSSIFFDFAYLRKPVIYTHFDYKEYRNTHYKEGYFDYYRDGFGPICKDIKCTINEISFELENNCILRRKFLRNIKRFFSFFDNKNSERILKEITKDKMNKKKFSKYTFSAFLSFILTLIFLKYIIYC